MNATTDIVHIVSLIVHVLPERVDAVVTQLAHETGAELVAQSGGKLVVLAETAHERDIVALTTRLGDIRGVLGVNLVYHHVEPADSLGEEIAHAPDPA
ncbi:MAG TPA: chaperone NapD [Tahibacter sp.]|nr:chaperone NapD [Tahibacter sp.]